ADGETCSLAYVNGDFFPDVIDLAHAARPGAQPGSVYVATGSATGFGTPALWGTGICAQAAGFCTLGWAYTGPAGVHTPPIILQVTPDGITSVSFSDGISSFGAPQQWGTGLCVHATACQLLDMNGDGIGDVVYKDTSDHSLSSSQLWVAYGRNS